VDQYRGLTIVIPTRNRDDLAANAIRSLLPQNRGRFRVLVSDNSTSAESTQRLRSFCDRLDDPLFNYVRPPCALPMAEHWDWAMSQALEEPRARHIAFLTDRMVFKEGGIDKLLATIDTVLDYVIVYNYDYVDDYGQPIRLRRKDWTGKVLELKSAHLLTLSSRIDGFSSIPVLLNSAVPRGVCERVRERFGSYCVSLSPDYCFGYRCLELEDRVFLFDESLIIHYALARSNGASCSRGVMIQDSLDFISSLREPLMSASPIPEIFTSLNGMLHEYNVVKSQSKSGKFPEIDMASYFRHITNEVNGMLNLELRDKLSDLIGEARQRFGIELTRQQPVEVDHRQQRPISRSARMNRVKVLIKKVLTIGPLKGFWFFLADRFGIRPPFVIDFEFGTTEKAIQFANAFPLPRATGIDHLNWLLAAGDHEGKSPNRDSIEHVGPRRIESPVL